VNSAFNQNNRAIPSDSSVVSMNQVNRDTITDHATQHGLKQDSIVEKQVEQDAKALISQSESEVGSKKTELNQKTQKLQSDINKNTQN
jgi:Skp family chaperone for outer membrane proteins